MVKKGGGTLRPASFALRRRRLKAIRRFVICPVNMNFISTSSGYTLDEIAAQQVVVGGECDGGVGGDSRNETH